MIIGTWLFTKMRGELVGTDAEGNRYFQDKRIVAGMRRKRWVMYNGVAEASRVPCRMAWLAASHARRAAARRRSAAQAVAEGTSAQPHRHRSRLPASGSCAVRGREAEAGLRGVASGLTLRLAGETSVGRNIVETIVGALVLVVACVFVFYAFSKSDRAGPDGYELTARFGRIDGLKRGADVTLSGVKVGSVTGFSLDPKTYQAVVRLAVSSNVNLPADTHAKIVSESLLGGMVVVLEPGSDKTDAEERRRDRADAGSRSRSPS